MTQSHKQPKKTSQHTSQQPTQASQLTYSALIPTRHVDTAVIGAGTAGQVAFKQVLKHRPDSVIISDGFWTTTCATVGCMPSKVLIACAERAYHAMHSQDFGIKTEVTIDGGHVMQHIRQERDRFAGFVQTQVDGWKDEQKIDGKAKIMGKNSEGHIIVAVNDEVIACQQLVIATGATPVVPAEWQDTLGDRLLTSDKVFELPTLPKSLAVIGAGAIGLEIAQAMARLGVTVTLLNRSDKIAGLTDDKVNQAAIDSLITSPVNEFYSTSNPSPNQHPHHDFTLYLNASIEKITPNGKNQIDIAFKATQGKTNHVTADYVLVAMGRASQLDTIGVTNIGVELDEKNRPKNLHPATGQVSDLPVYIVGDASGVMPLMHIASFQGTQAGKDIASAVARSQVTTLPVSLGIVFCQPQIAQVGANYETLIKQKEAGQLDLIIGEVNFANQGRSRVMGENQGLLRLYADKKGKILGASMVAPDAEYIAHLLAVAIMQNMTIADMLAMPFYHPTVLEGLRTALQNAQSQL